MSLLLEPINHRDKPGYFLQYVEQAAAIIEQGGPSPISRSCSIAITRRSCRAISSAVSRSISDLIGHVQIAGVPEPGGAG